MNLKIDFRKLYVFVIVFSVALTYSQSMRKMQGKLLDLEGNPLMGVTIILKGAEGRAGTVSEFDGSYTISSSKPYTSVQFTYIGMETKTLPFKDGEFDVVLEESLEYLGEVIVVTGYEKAKINETTGAINKVEMKNFQNRIAGSGSNIITTLEGLSSSIIAASNPGNPGSKQMLVRGISTLEGDASPLIVLDGFPYQGSIESINPYDIESITLLKDAASASIYGARSANGVIVITTKRGTGDGTLQLVYNTNFEITEKSNLEYALNRASSSEFIDQQLKYFAEKGDKLRSAQSYHEAGNNSSRAKSKIISLLLENKEGRLSDKKLNEQLDNYRKVDNVSDFEKLYLQLPIYKEHNLSVNYATENVKLRSSLNYNTNDFSARGKKNQGVKYNASTLIKVSDKLTLDLLANFNMNNSHKHKNSLREIFKFSSFERLFDEKGNPLAVTKYPRFSAGSINTGGKEPFEINRLLGLGLFDETYKPAENYFLGEQTEKSWRARFQSQMSLKLTNSLTGRVGFNISKANTTERNLTSKDSWEMKTDFNHLTKVTDDGRKGSTLIPIGDRLIETRSDNVNYLLRGQLDYDYKFNENNKFRVLLGSEIKADKFTLTSTDRLGYDSKSNLFVKNINHKDLALGTENTFHPDGYVGGYPFSEAFDEIENRYFSIYGNSNYTLNNKYVFHGSARIDQSNLFGTDPKYRYKPFWSTGFKWRLAEEEFFKSETISKLDLQVSYGFTGNISNEYGPYDMARFATAYRAFDKRSLSIYSPAINDLRWEKKKSLNFGLQSTMFEGRANLTLDYYREQSLDVLAASQFNPTLGFSSVTKNGSSIINNGLEVSLRTINVRTDNFMWNTYLGFNFNKSKVTNVYLDEDQPRNAAYRIASEQLSLEGYAPNSLFVFDTSITNEGNLEIRKANGDKINESDIKDPYIFKIDDLSHAGSTIPTFVGRLTNNLVYKDFGLSFMFIYQGGHVMLKDSYNGLQIDQRSFSMHKDVANAWKKAGDEKKENVRPAVGSVYYRSFSKNSKKNIISGDYLRLRDVVFSYSLPKNFISANNYVKECTFNLKAKNAFLWTKNEEGIDPESHGLGVRSFPVRKSLSLGVNVTF